MVNAVLYLTLDPPSRDRAQSLFERKGIPISCMALSEQHAAEEATQIVKKGARVILARGGMAAMLRRVVSVLVVPLTYDFMDFYRPVTEACERSDRVAVMGWYRHILWFEEYKKLLPPKVDYFELPNFSNPRYQDLVDEVHRLKELGYEYVVGGSAVQELAVRLGMIGLQVVVSDEAYLQAAREALYSAQVLQDKELWHHTAEAILENVREGFVFTDTGGRVRQINQRAKNILLSDPQHAAQNLSLEALGLNDALRKDLIQERKIRNRVFSTASGKSVLNGETLYLDGRPAGWLLTVQSMDSIRSMEKSLRKDAVRSGHYAKSDFSDILGQSPELLRAKQTARLYAASSSTILITGESGTGKEIFAQSIHNTSHRRGEPFVAVNCATMPENLLESELFGYVKGAFTGANSEGKIGIFEAADKGTIFLDEIGEMPLKLQARLLRVLQEKEITRVGDARVIPVDVRVVAATNRNLYQEVQNRAFREDLFYRLCVLSLALPPLRRRKEDVMPLLEHFMTRHGGEPRAFSAQARALLMGYDWPGNVREAANFVERICVLRPDGPFDEELVRTALAQPGREAELLPAPALDSDGLLLLEAIRECQGSRARAARMLGISRSTLWRRIKALEEAGVRLLEE